MKRYGNLWPQITDLENIKLAHKQARRGKSFYSEVKMVDADIDRYTKEIQTMLVNKSFRTSAYEVEDRFDGRKMRRIYKLPYYPDRIVQHALLNVIGPILVRGFIRDTFQSIPGRGTHDAMRRVKKLVISADCPKYALKVDVEKYYPSVNNIFMKESIRRKIKCVDTLWLVDDIINSIEGLPIGNYTSQHFGNLYLNQFDWWVKQHVKPRGYFRYCDDMLFFADTTEELIRIKNKIAAALRPQGLAIKDNWTTYNIEKQGVDFVGYVFKPRQTKLRRAIARSFKDAASKLTRAKSVTENALSCIMAYKGWVKYSNSKLLWREHVSQRLINTFPKQLKGAV